MNVEKNMHSNIDHESNAWILPTSIGEVGSNFVLNYGHITPKLTPQFYFRTRSGFSLAKTIIMYGEYMGRSTKLLQEKQWLIMIKLCSGGQLALILKANWSASRIMWTPKRTFARQLLDPISLRRPIDDMVEAIGSFNKIMPRRIRATIPFNHLIIWGWSS